MRTPSFYITSLVFTFCLLLCGCSKEAYRNAGRTILDIVPGFETEERFDVDEQLQEDDAIFTKEEEYHLGRAISARILKLYPLIEAQQLTEYLNNVGYAVALHSPKPETFGGYHFVVVESDELNSMAAPGGFIFITRGLLKLAHNEDQLAAVLAHEVAHVNLEHGLKSIAKENSTKSFISAGKIVSSASCDPVTGQITKAFAGAVGDVVNTLLVKGYSREQELEADHLAKEILAKTGYQDDSLAEMLKNLQSHGGHDSGGLFATHPPPVDRIGALEGQQVAGNKKGAEAPSIRQNRFNKAVGN